jgi:type IV secretory pathway VirB4 component
VAVYQQPDAFRAVLPEATDRVRATRQLDTSSLARTLPFVVATSTGRGIFLAVDGRTSSPVLFDAHDPNAPNASIAVVAPAGSGKSYTLKLLALRHRFLGVEVLILDPEAEYRRLARAVGGQVVRFAVSRGSHVNPFDLPPVEVDDQTGEPSDPVDEQAAALGGLFEVTLASPEAPLSTDQRATLDRAVLATYRQKGIEQGKPETWDREPPLLPDLHAALVTEGTEAARLLAGRLDQFVTGSSRGLFGPTDVRLDNPCTVFDIRDVPDELRPIVTHLVTAFVWRVVRRERKPRLFIADEAATLLERPDSARFVGNFARRCRKYYTGLCIAVQDVAHLQGSREGLDVLANAGTKLILGHRAERVDAAVAAFQLSEADRQALLAAGKGEGLFIARGDRRYVKVLASAEEHRLVTTRPDEVAAIEAAERAAGRTERTEEEPTDA